MPPPNSSQQTIALFATTMPVGGVPRMIVNISKGLCDQGIPVDLVLCRREGAFLQHLDPRVNIVELGSSFPLAVIWQLKKYFLSTKPRAFLATGLHRNLYAMIGWLLGNKPGRIILSERIVVSEYWTDRHPMWLQQAFKFIYKTLGRILFAKATAVHGVSTDVTDNLQAMLNLPESKLHVIYNPFINDTLLAKKTEKPDHAWMQDPTLKTIISVGRLHEQKDFTTLIRAFASTHQSMPEARLIILGEGSQRALLEAEISAHNVQDVVALPGFHDNPYSFMAHCDLFAHSSIYEGCANVLVEALACGAPVVSTTYKGGVNEVLEGGRYGTMVPARDPQAFANAMANTLRDPNAKERSKDFLLECGDRYSQAQSIEGYITLLTGEPT